jgi:DNA-binding MarR family transcriptional regulator
MDKPVHPSDERLKSAVDAFWESFPPFWHCLRGQIRQTAADQFGLTVEQYHILRHIRKGFGSVSELAHAKQISRSAASQTVELLARRGLVTRQQSETDRRQVHLTLSEQGDALLDAISGQTRAWMVQQFSVLDESELQDFTRLMQLLRKVAEG